MKNPGQLSDCTAPLLSWYEENARVLPWREDPTPYHVWVSEIMLQQTRVEAVKPYYLRFIARLPDLKALAVCPEEELLKLWEGLGYYSRVRNLQKAAQVCCAQYGGALPGDVSLLLKLPGIGPYTAGAIASIAFGIPVPAVDGNVLRVISRVTAQEEDIRQEQVKRRITQWLSRVLPRESPGQFNQALMELGACVCVPNGAPRCVVCPVAQLCAAYLQGRTGDLPVRSPLKKRKIQRRTVLVVLDGLRTLLFQRPPKGLLAGMYEFPSLEGELSDEQILRAVKSWGLTPVRMESLGSAKHIFTHLEWRMQGVLVLVEQLPEEASSRRTSPQEESPQWETLQDDGLQLRLPPGTVYRIADADQIQQKLAIPAAYAPFLGQLDVVCGCALAHGQVNQKGEWIE